MDRNLIKKITRAVQATTSKYFRVLSKEAYERNRERTISEVASVVDSLLKTTVDNMIENVDGLISDDITNIDTSEIKIALLPDDIRDQLGRDLKKETIRILAISMSREANLYLDLVQQSKAPSDNAVLQIPIEELEEGEWEYLAVEVQKTPPSILNEIALILGAVALMSYWNQIAFHIQEEVERGVIRAQRMFTVDGVGTQSNTSKFKNFLGSVFGKSWRQIKGRLIGQTEVSNGLNAARKATVKSLREDAHLPIKSIWVSALLPTTRDPHASLDGVPENENGMWDLDGIEVPYPAHHSLPPEHRINCLCTIMHEFQTDESAQ
tara:strand:+ start:3443 stop:4411 length:969 start_codon:yes stop_codon:yes gene_type:complete